MGLEALYSLDRLCVTQQQGSKEACIHSAEDGDGLCFNCAEAGRSPPFHCHIGKRALGMWVGFPSMLCAGRWRWILVYYAVDVL